MTDDPPQARRLRFPQGYEQPDADVPLLEWAEVSGRIAASENYWIATTRADGSPHVTPIWGAWVDGALYFDGSPRTQWGRNLAANPSIAIHLESGTEVVILEGRAEDLTTGTELADRITATWNTKYGLLAPDPTGSGILRLRPGRVRAWTRFPHDATLWTFPATVDAHGRPATPG